MKIHRETSSKILILIAQIFRAFFSKNEIKYIPKFL